MSPKPPSNVIFTLSYTAWFMREIKNKSYALNLNLISRGCRFSNSRLALVELHWAAVIAIIGLGKPSSEMESPWGSFKSAAFQAFPTGPMHINKGTGLVVNCANLPLACSERSALNSVLNVVIPVLSLAKRRLYAFIITLATKSKLRQRYYF